VDIWPLWTGHEKMSAPLSIVVGMTNSHVQARHDQEDAMVSQTIRKHGLFIQFVGGDPDDIPRTFAYTVGLFGLGHPELVIASVNPGTACGVLNELGARVRAGENFVAGQLLTFEEWPHRIVVEELPNPGEILFSANRHYQRPAQASVEAYQLTYDDRAGRFPWDEGYANHPDIQPRPGTWQA
jgi:hypothetical protein